MRNSFVDGLPTGSAAALFQRFQSLTELLGKFLILRSARRRAQQIEQLIGIAVQVVKFDFDSAIERLPFDVSIFGRP